MDLGANEKRPLGIGVMVINHLVNWLLLIISIRLQKNIHFMTTLIRKYKIASIVYGKTRKLKA